MELVLLCILSAGIMEFWSFKLKDAWIKKVFPEGSEEYFCYPGVGMQGFLSVLYYIIFFSLNLPWWGWGVPARAVNFQLSLLRKTYILLHMECFLQNMCSTMQGLSNNLVIATMIMYHSNNIIGKCTTHQFNYNNC